MAPTYPTTPGLAEWRSSQSYITDIVDMGSPTTTVNNILGITYMLYSAGFGHTDRLSTSNPDSNNDGIPDPWEESKVLA